MPGENRLRCVQPNYHEDERYHHDDEQHRNLNTNVNRQQSHFPPNIPNENVPWDDQHINYDDEQHHREAYQQNENNMIPALLERIRRLEQRNQNLIQSTPTTRPNFKFIKPTSHLASHFQKTGKIYSI